MRNEEFDKLIQERLAGFEYMPPEAAKPEVFRKLTAARRRSVYWRASLAVAVAIVLGGIVYFSQYLSITRQTPPETGHTSGVTAEVHPQAENPLQRKEQALADPGVYGESSSTEDAPEAASTTQGAGIAPTPGVPLSGSEPQLAQLHRQSKAGIYRNSVSPRLPVGNDEPAASAILSALYPKIVDPLAANLQPLKKAKWSAGQRRISGELPEELDEMVVMPANDKPWAIYLEAMPFFSYSHFEVDKTDELLVVGIEQVPSMDLRRLGWRLESGVEYELSPRLRAQLGLVLYHRKQNANLVTLSVDSVAVTEYAGGYNLKPVFGEDTLRMSIDILNAGWLAGLQYRLNLGRVQQWIGVSAELHKALTRNVVFESLSSASQPSAFYTFANLYYRAEYNWRPGWQLFVQPTFNYNLYVSSKMQAPVNVRPYGLGFSFGARLKF